MHAYHGAKMFKLPDSVPVSAGGLNKTSKITCFFYLSTLETDYRY